VIRSFALGLPGAWEDHPWGESVAKVGKKVFAFLGHPESDFGFSVKLPDSADAVLALPFATPTGYGLGKSGWVSFAFPPGTEIPPVGVLTGWIEESYRAIAGKRLVQQLDASR